jgi:antitoxin HicB
MYKVILRPDDNGTILVTCPDLPEVTTFGEDESDAVHRAADAIAEALAARIAHQEEIPTPSSKPSRTIKLGARRKIRLPMPPELELRTIDLPALITAKVDLYRSMRVQGVSKAELSRRLGCHGPQVDRLFDLSHDSTFGQIDRAARAIGKQLGARVQDAA